MIIDVWILILIIGWKYQRSRTNQVTECPRTFYLRGRAHMINSIDQIRSETVATTKLNTCLETRGTRRPVLLSLTREFFIKSTYIRRSSWGWEAIDQLLITRAVYIQAHRKCQVVCLSTTSLPTENSCLGYFYRIRFRCAVYNFVRAIIYSVCRRMSKFRITLLITFKVDFDSPNENTSADFSPKYRMRSI